MSDNIDWSEAPEGATHHLGGGQPSPWRKFDASGDYWHDGARWKAFIRDPEFPYIPKPEAHADDLAVDAFAQAMSARLAQCRDAGKSGWDDPEQCPPQRLAEGLVRAVRAGKLVDVGNYAMMLWKRGQMTQQEHRVRDWLDEAHRSDAAQHLGESVEWDGAGLPPVGTMVEVHYSDQSPYEALVVAEHLGEVVLWIGNGARTNYWRCDPAWLRPILTPEQRAAKERDQAVAAMCKEVEGRPDVQHANTSLDASVALRVAVEALYDLGYRKTD